jgi:hypothetical protein
MRRVLTDETLRRELAARGVARSRVFDWDVSAARLLDAFAGAIERRRAGAR